MVCTAELLLQADKSDCTPKLLPHVDILACTENLPQQTDWVAYATELTPLPGFKDNAITPFLGLCPASGFYQGDVIASILSICQKKVITALRTMFMLMSELMPESVSMPMPESMPEGIPSVSL